jgi:hypothetical protein
MFGYIDAILASPVKVPGQVIGYSREQRPIHAAVLGNGPVHISLIAGCHADEPVGPRFLRKLFAFLDSLEPGHPLLTHYRWWLAPHANPDGEVVNMRWYSDEDDLFDMDRYLRYVERELPGDDVEFGFPEGPGQAGLRPENNALYEFWLNAGAPFHLHGSLHGMMVAGGPWFLMEKEWIPRSQTMRRLCLEEVAHMGYALHDVDRNGEKGFFRISEGFCTRPDSGSMREYFEAQNNLEMSRKFNPSSMEAIRGIGGDPLTIVSEMPLFILPNLPSMLRWPHPVWEEWNSRLQSWKTHLRQHKQDTEGDQIIHKEILASGIIPMPVPHQMRLQWRFITAAIEQINM